MVRLWGKIIINEKVKKSFTLEKDEKFSLVSFIGYIEDICYNLGIPTPVILKYHIKNFFDFNSTRFYPRDFLEEVPFDEFAIESAVM